MPKGIGRQGIGSRVGLAQRQIAVRYGAGTAGADVLGYVNATSSTGSIAATDACIALIYAIGGGGTGSGDVNCGGGGGGGAAFKRYRLSQGQTISYSVGAAGTAPGSGDGLDGNDTTVTLPSGAIVRAGGGKKGTSAGVGGLGGRATGCDVPRTGGAGGATSTAGSSGGAGGGAGGAVFGAHGGGGGSAGFGDLLSIVTGGAGGSSTAGVSPGGGGGASDSAAGLVVIFLVRTY